MKDNSQNPVLRGQLTAAIASNTRGMARPQEDFEDAPIDNTRERLFELKLRTKPNAVVPLPDKFERFPAQSTLPVS